MPRKCRDDSWNDFRDDSCDDGPRGDAGARRIGRIVGGGLHPSSALCAAGASAATALCAAAHVVVADRLGSAFHPDVLFAEAVADAEIEAAARIPVFAPAAEGRRVRGAPVPAVFLEGVVAHDAQVELLLEELLFDAHVIVVVAFRFAAEPRIPRRIILTQHKPRLLPEREVEVEVLAERELVGVDVHGVEIVLRIPAVVAQREVDLLRRAVRERTVESVAARTDVVAVGGVRDAVPVREGVRRHVVVRQERVECEGHAPFCGIVAVLEVDRVVYGRFQSRVAVRQPRGVGVVLGRRKHVDARALEPLRVGERNVVAHLGDECQAQVGHHVKLAVRKRVGAFGGLLHVGVVPCPFHARTEASRPFGVGESVSGVDAQHVLAVIHAREFYFFNRECAVFVALLVVGVGGAVAVDVFQPRLDLVVLRQRVGVVYLHGVARHAVVRILQRPVIVSVVVYPVCMAFVRVDLDFIRYGQRVPLLAEGVFVIERDAAAHVVPFLDAAAAVFQQRVHFGVEDRVRT